MPSPDDSSDHYRRCDAAVPIDTFLVENENHKQGRVIPVSRESTDEKPPNEKFSENHPYESTSGNLLLFAQLCSLSKRKRSLYGCYHLCGQPKRANVAIM
ncbi:hypothetical protein RB195_011332 [Necator americanus]|uniref:Uncharacterized protein n=1 Tax=Necator americanus TaxID=51031 RepID=A0ABR1D1X3_NECAM